MLIAASLDVHKVKCVAYAVYGGSGKPTKRQTEYLDEFNRLFRRMDTSPEGLAPMARYLEGHEAHFLIENSTSAHNVYWILRNLGLDVVVARATDLYQITKSTQKNDDNDSRKLAEYMRRYLNGEREFAVCLMAPPEWMMRRQFIRTVFSEKEYLSDNKRRIHAHLMLTGTELPKKYKDITCLGSTRQLKSTGDPVLVQLAGIADDLRRRIRDGEGAIMQMFVEDQNYGRLLTVPGVGVMTAAYISSITIDPFRFDGGDRFASYLGLVPKQHASADSNPRCRITKTGDTDARRMVTNATMVHINLVEDSIVTQKYHRLKANGVPHKKALTACARKMAEVMLSVMKSGIPYTTDQALLRRARQNEDGILEEQMVEEVLEDISRDCLEEKSPEKE